MNVKPIKKKLLVRKCLPYEPELHDGKIYYRDGGIVVTDVRGTYTHWAEIISVASDCSLFDQSDVGAMVYLPEWKPGRMHRVSRELQNGVPIEEFMVSERLFTEPNGAIPMIYRP